MNDWKETFKGFLIEDETLDGLVKDVKNVVLNLTLVQQGLNEYSEEQKELVIESIGQSILEAIKPRFRKVEFVE